MQRVVIVFSIFSEFSLNKLTKITSHNDFYQCMKNTLRLPLHCQLSKKQRRTKN